MRPQAVDIHDIENRLWDSADELRANSGLKSSEYSVPMLGLIFLKYADSRFSALEAELAGQGSGRRQIGKADYQAKGVMYLPAQARFGHLLNLPDGSNLGQAVNDAMKAIEENEELRGVLPRTYNALSNSALATLLRNVNAILGDIDGDEDAFDSVGAFDFVMANPSRQDEASRRPALPLCPLYWKPSVRNARAIEPWAVGVTRAALGRKPLQRVKQAERH
jgi:type I restriction-modification system DNA methylase subunit